MVLCCSAIWVVSCAIASCIFRMVSMTGSSADASTTWALVLSSLRNPAEFPPKVSVRDTSLELFPQHVIPITYLTGVCTFQLLKQFHQGMTVGHQWLPRSLLPCPKLSQKPGRHSPLHENLTQCPQQWLYGELPYPSLAQNLPARVSLQSVVKKLTLFFVPHTRVTDGSQGICLPRLKVFVIPPPIFP